MLAGRDKRQEKGGAREGWLYEGGNNKFVMTGLRTGVLLIYSTRVTIGLVTDVLGL